MLVLMLVLMSLRISTTASSQTLKGRSFSKLSPSRTIARDLGLDSPTKLLAYAGILPSTYQSGQMESSYSHMEKRGYRYLRYTLINAAKYVCLWEPTFEAYLVKSGQREAITMSLSPTLRKTGTVDLRNGKIKVIPIPPLGTE